MTLTVVAMVSYGFATGRWIILSCGNKRPSKCRVLSPSNILELFAPMSHVISKGVQGVTLTSDAIVCAAPSARKP
jgi:hypothetical protein